METTTAVRTPREARLRQTRASAAAARRYAIWALGSSGVGILLALHALLSG